MKNLLRPTPIIYAAKIYSTCCLMIVMAFLSITKASAQSFNAPISSITLSTDSVLVYTNLNFSIKIGIDSPGISTGGSISIQMPANWGLPQFTNTTLLSGGQNPVVDSSTNASVTFHDTTDWMTPIYGIYTNEVHYCTFKITSVAGLGPLDTVYIKYGVHAPDHHNGWGFTPSRLARTEQIYFQTKQNATATPSPVDSVPIIQYPQPIYRLNALAKSNPTIGSPFQVNVVAFDKLNNPDYFYHNTIHFSNVTGDSTQITWPADYTFIPNDAGIHDFTFTVTDYGLHRIRVTDVSTGMTTMLNPIIVDTSGMKIWWGDLHSHSQYSHHGLHFPVDVFNYAKSVSFLDFMAFTEHSYIPDSQYRSGIALANQFNQDGSFVTFNGYEWSTSAFGHQNAIFNNSNPPAIINEQNSPTLFSNTVKMQGGLIDIAHPTGLWGGGSSSTNPGLASFSVDWDHFDPAVQTMVEVTGNSGICFEFIPDTTSPNAYWANRQVTFGTGVQDGLARHYIFGMIGASDNHQGRPGKNPNPEAAAALTYVYPNLTTKEVGICASFAPSLTRDDIFTSLGIRHNYATTGARILLKFNIGNHMMGDYFIWDSLAGFPTLTASIHGTDTISRIEIVKDNQTIAFFTDSSLDYSFNYIDSTASYGSYYYLRIFQTNSDMAWSSPIWLLDSSSFTTNQLYLQSKFDVGIFPNPNTGNFQLQFFNNYSTTCLLTITDVTGKEVYNKTITNLSPFSNTSINVYVPDLNDGMYFLNVTCDNYLVHKKLVIEQTKK